MMHVDCFLTIKNFETNKRVQQTIQTDILIKIYITPYLYLIELLNSEYDKVRNSEETLPLNYLLKYTDLEEVKKKTYF